jgi:DNA polymerase (family 10)
MVKRGDDLSKLPEIGKDLAGKIAEIVKTGKLPLLEDLKKELPVELSDLMRISALGPKRIKALHEKLGVNTLEELAKAARSRKIRELDGFGEKTEAAILEEIGKMEGVKERIKLVEAEQIAESLIDHLKKGRGVKNIAAAGSYRRRKETVGDLDILVTHGKDSDVMEHFTKYEDVEKVVSKGKTRSTIMLRSNFQVDLRAVAEVSYGAALHYFTGSKAHNIAIRKLGMKEGLKINEYGVFRGDKRIAGKTEEEVYREVGLPYIEPELREDRGEIEAAQKGKLPKLVVLEDIKGDLHAHTKLTDGHASLEDMAEGAKGRGYEYLAITEHSRHVSVAKGLDKEGLADHIGRIDNLNKKLKGITLLKSIELDILEDGTLDLPDDILKELDIVVCSVHYKFNLTRKKQTERIIKAMDNPYFNILSHATGRLINEREPYEVDMESVMKAAKERGCFLELNAYPDRLDLNDTDCKMAKDMGIKVAISTDAHSVNDLDFMRFGIGQARRGWLEADDVLNTRSWTELQKLLKRK